MKKLQRRFAPTPAAISETPGRYGTKSLAELSEIPKEEARPLPSWLTRVLGLKADARGLPSWLAGVLGLVAGGVVGAATTVWAARRTRRGALDQSVHDKRLESYPQLVRATQRLAVYFPVAGPPIGPISPKDCEAMGRAMSEWYFGGGGLLMSVKTRNVYFSLARALTRASLAQELRVPTLPKDAEHISVEKLKDYQKELKDFHLKHVEGWRFGGPTSQNEPLSHSFKDYIFLQRLGSVLRTRLSKDLRSRRPPS